MKIKTLKIKIESENQTLDFDNFMDNTKTVYTTHAQVVQEAGESYWHVLFTYNDRIFTRQTYETSKPIVVSNVPQDLIDEVKAFVAEKTFENANDAQTIINSIGHVYGFRSERDFIKLRGFGIKSFAYNEDILKELMQIIKKYQVKHGIDVNGK